MCRIKVSGVEEGLIPSEKVVTIRTSSGGTEEITVFKSLVKDNVSLRAAFVGRDPEKQAVLVELPAETTTGRRRVWVREAEVVEA